MKNLVMTTFPAFVFFIFSCSGVDSECELDSECDDGIFCNGLETCRDNRCLRPGSRDCSDQKSCTIDSCDEENDQCLNIATDHDGDGAFAPDCDGDDCDDGDPNTYPGAEELCDGHDNDCDGVIAEDKDGDSHFDVILCPDGDDCDDHDPSVFAGALETCDGVDNNCLNGTDDEADTDGDGAIDPTCNCDQDCDCDDEDPAVYPGAPETCDGLDNNCDEEPDDGLDCIMGELYLCETTCETEGTVECSSECTFPTLPDECIPPEELCNAIDDDCDELIDEDFHCSFGEIAECTTVCGTTGTGLCTETCEPAAEEDCAAPQETCNGIDDNCNFSVDEGFDCPAGQDSLCTTTCNTTGTGPCSDECTFAPPELCIAPPEICNDLIDNDCDEDIDCADEDCIMDIACG